MESQGMTHYESLGGRLTVSRHCRDPLGEMPVRILIGAGGDGVSVTIHITPEQALKMGQVLVRLAAVTEPSTKEDKDADKGNQ